MVFRWFRSRAQEQQKEAAPQDSSALQEVSPQPLHFWQRLKQGLSKTRRRLFQGLSDLFRSPTIDASVLARLERCLLEADVGPQTTESFLEDLRQQAERQELQNGQALRSRLKMLMIEKLSRAAPSDLIFEQKPYVILVVGINGSGKTTSIAKMAHLWKHMGHSVLLAAGDTYRAAAVEQLRVWADRLGLPIVAQQAGADSAAVVFDAYQSAVARGCDILIADTAGRLHTQHHLMDEMSKIKRVLAKKSSQAPQEVWLVLDGSMGQNILRQVEAFHETLGVTGLIVTKLDGTAKAGVLFALTERFGLPVRFLGVGEQADDLQPFDPEAFVQALLEEEHTQEIPVHHG